jgi:hypothetical protein
MPHELRHSTEDLLRAYGELDRRVAGVGMEGIVGLLTTAQQVESAIAVLGSHEIALMLQELRRLLERLVRLDSQLQELRALKMIIATDDEPDRDLVIS